MLLDNAARELEIVKLELDWKDKRISMIESTLDKLQIKEKEATESSAGAFDDSISCEVCGKIYENPVLLVPCGHSFCSSCINKSAGVEDMKCFECHSDVTCWVENCSLALACKRKSCA